MLCGIFVLGLPIVVVGGAFDEVFKEEDEEQKRIALEVQRLEDAAAETVSTHGTTEKHCCVLHRSPFFQSLSRRLVVDFVNASPVLPTWSARLCGCCGQEGGDKGVAEASEETAETFNTEASIRAMAALMEQLYMETGNDRFDTAYNRLLRNPAAHV